MLRVVAIATLGSVLMWSGCGDTDESPEAVGSPSPTSNNVDSALDHPVCAHAAENSGSTATGSAAGHQTVDALDETELAVMDDYDDFDVGFEQDQPLPPYNAITREEFDACWQTSLTANGESAGELLRQLTEECGFAMDDQPQFADALSMLVNLEMVGVSRLQIIEEICSQVGLYPRYRLDRFALAAGPRPFPIAFAGPFLVEVRELQENPPYGTGMITVQFTGCTMSPDVNSWLQSGGNIIVTTSILGQGGVDIADGDSDWLEFPAATREVVRHRAQQDLKHLVRHFEQIDLLSGVLRIRLPAEVVSERFVGLAIGQEYRTGKVTVETTTPQFGDERGMQVIVSTGETYHDIQVELHAYDASGSSLDVIKQIGLGRVGRYHEFVRMYFLVDGVPESVEVRTVASVTEFELPFSLAEIPLSRSSEMQETIEPLMFDAEAPVTLSVVEIMEHGHGTAFLVEAVNHSNKDLSLVEMKIRCLNADGEELREAPHSHPGFPAVAAHETAQIRIPGFVAPEGMVNVELELVAIRALDATTWEAEER